MLLEIQWLYTLDLYLLNVVYIIINAPLAQVVEQLTLNQWVQGSNP